MSDPRIDAFEAQPKRHEARPPERAGAGRVDLAHVKAVRRVEARPVEAFEARSEREEARLAPHEERVVVERDVVHAGKRQLERNLPLHLVVRTEDERRPEARRGAVAAPQRTPPRRRRDRVAEAVVEIERGARGRDGAKRRLDEVRAERGRVLRAQTRVHAPEKHRNAGKDLPKDREAPRDARVPVGHPGRQQHRVGLRERGETRPEGGLAHAVLPIAPRNVPVRRGLWNAFARDPEASVGQRLFAPLVDAVDQGDGISARAKLFEQVEQPERLGPHVAEREVEDRRVDAEDERAVEPREEGVSARGRNSRLPRRSR